jgi:hypothetical protein
MINEEKSTEINVDLEVGQAIQFFETLIKSEGTKDLQIQWLLLKKGILERGTAPPPPPPPVNFNITFTYGSGVTELGTAPPPPPPPVNFNITFTYGSGVTYFGTGNPPPIPPIQIQGLGLEDKVKQNLADS